MDTLTEALTKIEEQAYYLPENWADIKQGALDQGCTTPTDCYPIIYEIIEQLNDNHSFFIGADQLDHSDPRGKPVAFGFVAIAPDTIVVEIFPQSAADKAGIQVGDVITHVNGEPPNYQGKRLMINPQQPVNLTLQRGTETIDLQLEAAPLEASPMPHGRLLTDTIGYIELFVQGDQSEKELYAQTAHDVIKRLQAEGAEAWVVDLRRDRGGNMWPMLAAVGPILGEGVVGWTTGRAGIQEYWNYSDGASKYRRESEEDFTAVVQVSDAAPSMDMNATRVALLHSHLTESAGEMITVAFQGRPNLRSFGAPTSGLTTAVGMQELSDGSLLGVTASLATDRTGTAYEGPIHPDEDIPVDWRTYGSSDDPVIQAALAWLT